MKLIKPSYKILYNSYIGVSVSIECDSNTFAELKQYNPFATGGQSTCFIIPYWSMIQPGQGAQSSFGLLPFADILWLNAIQNAEDVYRKLREYGMPRYEAQTVLPASLHKTIVITKSLKVWLVILSKKEMSEEMKVIMLPLRDELTKLL